MGKKENSLSPPPRPCGIQKSNRRREEKKKHNHNPSPFSVMACVSVFCPRTPSLRLKAQIVPMTPKKRKTVRGHVNLGVKLNFFLVLFGFRSGRNKERAPPGRRLKRNKKEL
jgi:hypothetical protein